MNHERPCHGDIGRKDQAKKESRIENVAVHCCDVWHSPEDVWIPLRKSVSCLEDARAKLTECVSGDVLIAVGACQKLAVECRIAERHRTERVKQRCPEATAPGTGCTDHCTC